METEDFLHQMIYTDKVHIVADSIEELHEFAASVGLKRACWFEGMSKGHPHYDMPKYLKSAVISDERVMVVKSSEILVKSKEMYKAI